MKATHLRTEYLDRPMPLDVPRPRLYWHCEGGKRQTAYRVVAEKNSKPYWDSGKVASSSMTHIPLGGAALESRDRVTWRVCLWDENDVMGEWSESCFEVGLLNESDWSAKWISAPFKPQKNNRYPVDLFRKRFKVENIASARLYISAMGVYEAELNGRRVGNFILAPGSTDYRKRVQYQAYDVTNLLNNDNELIISLSDGWYRGSLGAYGQTAVYGRVTKLRAALEMTDEAGNRTLVGTDESWDWCNDGPITFADLQDGENVDFTKAPSFNGKAALSNETVRLVASSNVPVTEHERFKPTLIHTPSEQTVLDFGQNIAGQLCCRLRGSKGQKLTIRLGETFDSKGNFTQSNFQLTKPVKEWGTLGSVMLMTGMGDKLRGEKQKTPLQQVNLILSGKTDEYRMRFAIAGFRYALVEGVDEINPDDWESIAVYSDMEDASAFNCSDAFLNRLFENVKWSMKGNFADVPTDCPTRERLGWTGDAQLFFDTAARLMDVSTFYKKYMLDLEDAQLKSGAVPAVASYSGMDLMYNNSGVSAGWCDALALIPYRFWKTYGDRAALERFYPMMKKFGLFLTSRTGLKDKKAAKANPYNKYTYEKGVHLGEWLEPKDLREKKYGAGMSHAEECTAYLHYSMSCLYEAATALGEEGDAALWKEYADGAVKAYCFLILKDGAPDTDRQAKLVRPLALGLCDDDAALKAEMQKRLIQAVRNRDYHVATGFLSTPFLLDELTKAGAGDVAWRTLLNDTAPGWLYEVKRGATTMWETWEGYTDDANSGSLNHYSPGTVVSWLLGTAAGINVVGEKRFRVSPLPCNLLDSLEASQMTLYGKLSVKWRRAGDKTEVSVGIPSNTTATFVRPDGSEIELTGGVYSETIG